jgi:hypothetical protein
MGGNAIPGVRRYDRQEFEYIKEQVCCTLMEDYGLNVAPLLYYKDKSSFGDLDIIVEWDKDLSDGRKLMIDALSPRVFIFNDTCVSLNVDELQVDLILTKKEFFDTSYYYYAYNDLGNLMGRIAKSLFGCKYGWHGLSVPIRAHNNTQELSNHIISQDSPRIFDFLGFDWDRFEQGFDSLDDIFTYVMYSKYFRAEFFDLDNLNHINRTRNRKRANYAAFLEAIEKEGAIFKGQTPTYDVDTFFPEAKFKETAEALIDKSIRHKQSKEKALQIFSKVGFSNIEIGKCMSKLRNDFPNQEDYCSFIEVQTPKQLIKYVQY